MSTQAQIRFWLLATGLFLLVVWALRGVLLPFVAGFAIAYFLNPPVAALCRQKLPRAAAAGITILAAIFVAVAIVLLILPVLQSQFLALINVVPTYAETFHSRVVPWLMHVAEKLSPDDVEKLRGALSDHAGAAMNWVAQFLKQVLSGSLAIFDILTLVFITPLVAFYVLRDWETLTGVIDRALPRRHYAVIRAQLNAIDQTLAGFVRGQALVCISLGIFYATGLTMLGLDFGAAVGLTTGVLSFIPYVGSTFGLLMSLILGAGQFGDWPHLVGILAVFGCGQILEGYILTPKLVGDRVGLHPVWIIFGLFAGASLLGFLGMLIAVPVAAVIGVLLRFGMTQYRDSAYYRDDTPAVP